MLVTRKGLAILSGLLALTYATQSIAGPFEDGFDAYKKKNYELAMKLWMPLAHGDDRRAQAGVAQLFYSGLGVEKDLHEAIYWGEKAAAQGWPGAQYILGTMYRNGEGVKKDLPRARELLQKAADQNHPWAQYHLGLMYYKAEGGPQDNITAYKWLSLATLDHEGVTLAGKGEDAKVVEPARFALHDVASEMTPDDIAEAKRRVREWKPVHLR